MKANRSLRSRATRLESEAPSKSMAFTKSKRKDRSGDSQLESTAELESMGSPIRQLKRARLSMPSAHSNGDYLRWSTWETALDDLRENGYFCIKKAIPVSLCEPCAKVIQKDIGRRLDEGSPHQEEPIERLEKATRFQILKIRDFVLSEIFQGKLGVSPVVPDTWTETLYGRVKRKNFMTRWHCDAFNTLFERGLLEKENLPEGEIPKLVWSKIRKTGKVSCAWSDIPIFTFWIALRPVEDSKSSHLRILPKSHEQPKLVLRSELKNVVPVNFEYCKTQFVGPEFPDGYAVGDLVVFHCLTQHEANAHQAKANEVTSGERISMDGRFYLRL